MYVFLKYQNKKVSDHLFSVRTTAAAGSALTMKMLRKCGEGNIDRTTLTSLFVLIYGINLLNVILDRVLRTLVPPFSQSTIDAFTATLENETLGRLVLILLQSVLSWAILFLITIGILIGNPQKLLFV